MIKTEHDPKIVYLKVTDYVGLSLGAIHTYGEMKCRVGDMTKMVRVERPMTQEEATRENKKDWERGFRGNLNKPGQLTSRLKDEDDVIKTALDLWRNHFPWTVVLILDTVGSNPKKILAGPEEDRNLILKINNMWVDWLQAEDEGFTREELEELDDDWSREINRYLETLELACEPEMLDEQDEDIAFVLEQRKKEKEEQERREAEYRRREDEQREARRKEMENWHDKHAHYEVTLTLTARTTMDADTHCGYLTFFCGGLDATGDDGEDLGSVKTALDGGVWFSHPTLTEHSFQIKGKDVWEAFYTALSEGRAVRVEPKIKQ